MENKDALIRFLHDSDARLKETTQKVEQNPNGFTTKLLGFALPAIASYVATAAMSKSWTKLSARKGWDSEGLINRVTIAALTGAIGAVSSTVVSAMCDAAFTRKRESSQDNA